MAALRKVQPGSLILVHFVEQQLEGWVFTRQHWPLHITLVPWFRTKDEEAVGRALDRLAGETAPMVLSVGKPEPMGANRKLANIIKNQKPVQTLHDNLLAALQGADAALHEKRFTGKEYRAHISQHKADKRRSNEGERVMFNDFHLVRLLDDNFCLVEQAFDLLKR